MRPEVLGLDRRLQEARVAAESRDAHAGINALPLRRGDRVVDRVVEVGRRDLAGDDAVQRVGTGHALVVEVGEQIRGGLAEGDHARAPEAVGQAQARETAAQRIAQEGREARRSLPVVEDVVLAELVEERDQVRAGEDRGLASLVEAEAAREDGEAGLDGLVEQIGFRVAELQHALAAAELGVERERFAEAEEVVGRVPETDEAARESRDAAVEVDHVPAALLDLEREVDQALAGVARHHRVGLGTLGLDRIEVAQLVEPQHADIPQAGVEHVALVQQQLAADDLVAGRVVAVEFDAAHEELLAFVDRQVQIDLGRVVVLAELEAGLGDEVDVAELAVQLLEVLHALAELLHVEDRPFPHREDRPENLIRDSEQFDIGEAQLAALVAGAFLDKQVDVGKLLRLVEEHRPRDQEGAASGRVADVEVVLEDVGPEVAALLVGVAEALLVFLELADVEGAREQVLQHEAARDPERLGVLHGAPRGLAAHHFEPLEGDVAHLDLGAFVDVEDDLDRGRGDLADFGPDVGVLAAALSQQFAQHVDRAIDGRGIVARLDGQPDAALLEAFQDVRERGGLVALVADRADDPALRHEEAHDLAGLAIFDFQAQVVEVPGVPEHHEVPAQGLRIVQVSALGENARRQAVARDAPGPAKSHFLDDVLARPALLLALLLNVLEGRLRLRLFQGDVLERRDRLLGLGQEECRGFRPEPRGLVLGSSSLGTRALRRGFLGRQRRGERQGCNEDCRTAQSHGQ